MFKWDSWGSIVMIEQLQKNGLYWISNEDRTSKLLLHEGFGICLYDQSFLGLMNGADFGLL